MKDRTLGPARLSVSSLGLGCMGFSQGYGPADDDESVATMQRALDLGVTLLDTAMSYGRGHSEMLVGRAMAGRREHAVVATKFGIVRGDDGAVRVDGRPEHVRGYCEASPARHRPDRPVLPASDRPGGADRGHGRRDERSGRRGQSRPLGSVGGERR